MSNPTHSGFLKSRESKVSRTATMVCFLACVIGCLFIFVVGCDERDNKFTFTCDMQKVDGKVVSLSVTMPYKGMKPAPLTLNNRKEVQGLIDSLESLILDLELSRDQMAVEEPDVPHN